MITASYKSLHFIKVRGAPLIAIVAALGLAVEAGSKYPSEARGLGSAEGAATAGAAAPPLADAAAAATYLIDRMTYLRTSRPTAVRCVQ